MYRGCNRLSCQPVRDLPSPMSSPRAQSHCMHFFSCTYSAIHYTMYGLALLAVSSDALMLSTGLPVVSSQLPIFPWTRFNCAHI